MNSELKMTFDIVDERLGRSDVLTRLGYSSRIVELKEETEFLWPKCYFHVVTGQYRCLSICCHYINNADHLFTFEIFHTLLDESFLLDDWTRHLRNPTAPYAFLLSTYRGDFKEKLHQLISYVDTLLSIDEIDKILKGDIWTDFAEF